MTFRTSIDVVESMGSDIYVYFTLDSEPSRVRARGARP